MTGAFSDVWVFTAYYCSVPFELMHWGQGISVPNQFLCLFWSLGYYFEFGGCDRGHLLFSTKGKLKYKVRRVLKESGKQPPKKHLRNYHEYLKRVSFGCKLTAHNNAQCQCHWATVKIISLLKAHCLPDDTAYRKSHSQLHVKIIRGLRWLKISKHEELDESNCLNSHKSLPKVKPQQTCQNLHQLNKKSAKSIESGTQRWRQKKTGSRNYQP